MIIKSIHIDSFGPLTNIDFSFSDGLNIIEGLNESGKSSIAMFIKFMLYGLSGRTIDKEMSEKQKYVSWASGKIGGTMTVVTDKEYRIERELFSFSDSESKSREKCCIVEVGTLSKVFVNEIPGEALLGMPEQIFINTVFVGQLTDGKINGDGMIEAIENILLSGDEGVSTKKATKKLEEIRVSLRHKNGSGGKIYELSQEKTRLNERLDEAITRSSEIIDLESSILELDKNINIRKEKAEFYGSVCEAYKKIESKKQIDTVREYAENINSIEESLHEFDKYGSITEKIIDMQRLSAELDSVNSRLDILRSRVNEMEDKLPKMSDEEIELARGDVARAEQLLSKSKSSRALGIVCLLITVILVVGNFFIPLINLNWIHTVVLGLAGVLAIIGVISIVNSIIKKKKQNDILTDWNVDSIDNLEVTIENSIRLSKLRNDPKSEYSEVIKSLEITSDKKVDLSTQLRKIAILFCSDDSDLHTMTETAIKLADQYAQRVEDLKSQRHEIYGKYSVLSYILGEDGGASIDKAFDDVMLTDAGRTAIALTESEISDYEKNYRFATGTLPQLQEQRNAKNTNLSVLRASNTEPVAIQSNLDKVCRELNDSQKKFEAVSLAIDTIKAASEGIRKSLLPRVAEESGKIIGNFSSGKYSKLGVDYKFEMSFESNGKSRNIAYLSAGTKDIAYICVRMALANALFDSNIPPSIYDESFARIDEIRLEKILDLLTATGSPQSFVFTCRKLESKIAKQFENVNVISL